jgi:hypothetical protein
MAWVAVASYYVRYNTKESQPVVGIYYRESGNAEGRLLAQHFPMSAQDALFTADMLRNEAPIFFDPDTGALASGKEGVGEGEVLLPKL